MSEARIEALGGERYRVTGVLDAFTTPKLLEEGLAHFSSQSSADIQVDLSGVTESDSAGLAVLLEWLRTGRKRNQRFHFGNVPKQLAALARISEVEELIQPTAG